MGSPLKPVASTQSFDDAGAYDYPVVEELDPSLIAGGDKGASKALARACQRDTLSAVFLASLGASQVDGFQIFYEREVPFELRSASTVDVPTEVGALEALRVKILVKGGANQLEAVRVELSSESNLFFHYTHDLDAKSFAEVQETQRLMIDFADYPSVMLRMLNACIREPHLQLAVLLLQPSGEARLDFIQNMEYKFVELLSCRFWASPEEVVRAQVSYRYTVVKARMQLLQSRLADINQMVKVKNPSLLLQLQRTAPRFPPGSNAALSASPTPQHSTQWGVAGATQGAPGALMMGSGGMMGSTTGVSPAKPVFRT